MRVMHVVPSVAERTGGPASSVIQAARSVSATGGECAVFATTLTAPAGVTASTECNGDDCSEPAPGVVVRQYPTRHPTRLAYSPALARGITAEVLKYDVVHIHSLFLYPQYAAFRAATRARVPYIVSPRGALDPWLRRRGRVRKAVASAVWQRRMLEGARMLHVTSQQEATFVEDLAAGVPRMVIPNGLDWSAFQDAGSGRTFRERYLDGFEGPVVAVHGRLARKKGLDLLVRAFKLVTERVRPCRLALIGPDDEGVGSELVGLATREKVATMMVLCGLMTGALLRDALAATDVWVLPSHTENFGVAVGEAMASSVPVVVSRGVGIAEDAERAGAALVLDERTPRALAALIVDLLTNESARTLLGARGRAYARRFDSEALGTAMLEMYREAVR